MNPHDSKTKNRSSYLEHVMGEDTHDTRTVNTLDALSVALRTGFRVLKVLMVLLAVVFAFSNIFWVPEGYVAVQSRFGKIVKREAAAVHPPGGPYLAFPYPVDKIIRIPTSIQKVTVFNAFWSEEDAFEPIIDDRPETQGLRPGVHGSLITADKNLVQGIWVIHYKMDKGITEATTGDPLLNFIHNVGSMECAEEIIHRAAQSAVIQVVSKTKVADFIAGRIENKEIKQLIQADLKQLNTGLTVTGISASQYAAPKILVPDFQAATQAESEKALEIEKASRHRLSTLNELAGAEWQSLLDTIDVYEKVLQGSDNATKQAAFETAKHILLTGGYGGFIAQMLDEARSEKTTIIQRTRAAAARFNKLLPFFQKNPEVLINQMIQDTVKEIRSDFSVETVYVPKGQKMYLDLGEQDLGSE